MKRLITYLQQTKQWILSIIIARYLSDYLRAKGGNIKLDDDTWIVHQSDKFHWYCQNIAYEEYEERM